MKNWAILIGFLFVLPLISAVNFEDRYSSSYNTYFYISKITAPSDVNVWQDFDVFVDIKGVGWNGTTVITTTSDLSVAPSSTNSGIFEGENSVKFHVQPGDKTGAHTLIFKVCEVSQFSANQLCDERQVSVYVSKESALPWLLIIPGVALLIFLIVAITVLARKKK